MSILLENCTYIDWQTLDFIPCHIKVEEGKTGKTSILPLDQPINKGRFTSIIPCKGRHVTKSFAVGHHHVYSALARGMHAPEKWPQNFLETLQFIWWQLDKALDEDAIRASALATAIFCAKDGSTFVIDHHASPNHIKGSLNIIADVFDEVGLSHLLCYEISDRDGVDRAEAGYRLTDEFLGSNQGLVGLHASFTLGDKSLSKAKDLMEKHHSGIHIHVAEDLIDQELTMKNHQKTVVQRLSDFGFLDSPKTILAHCLHLSEQEKQKIKNSKAWIVQNMESNLNNKVGIFRGDNLGDRIMLGTDGMHSDMIRSAQYAYFASERSDGVDPEKAYRRMRNVHHYISDNQFSGDGENNLVVLNYDGPTEFNKNNFLSHLIYGFHGGHVQHVISDGRLIVKDHVLQNIDEQAALLYAREQSERLWKRMH
jgi:cytosine/adenosine deaminase-related metal-dependent hydrolase